MGDGRTRYNKMVQLLKPLVGQTLHIEKLRKEIMIEIGTSETVVRESLKFMIDLGLIHETDHLIFKVEQAEIRKY